MSDFHHIRQLGHNLGHRRRNRGGGQGGKLTPPPVPKVEGVQQYGFAPPHILEQNLQFPGKFAERPFLFFYFFFIFYSLFFFIFFFLGIFKNLTPSLKFRPAAYDLGRHMFCFIHNSFKLRSKL